MLIAGTVPRLLLLLAVCGWPMFTVSVYDFFLGFLDLEGRLAGW
jgi:hypothetical protein